MPFVSETIEEQTIKEFANICGIKQDEVGVTVNDNAESPQINLKSHVEMKDEARDYDITITMNDKTKFQIVGNMTITGKATQKRDINQQYLGNAQALPKALSRLLSKVKVKQNPISKYFGG